MVTFPYTPTWNNNIKSIYFKTHVSDSSELWLLGHWKRILFSSQHLWLFQEAIPAFSSILSTFLTSCSMSPLHLLPNRTLSYQTGLLLSCTSYIFLYMTPFLNHVFIFIFCVGVVCCMCSCPSPYMQGPQGSEKSPWNPWSWSWGWWVLGILSLLPAPCVSLFKVETDWERPSHLITRCGHLISVPPTLFTISAQFISLADIHGWLGVEFFPNTLTLNIPSCSKWNDSGEKSKRVHMYCAAWVFPSMTLVS